MTDSVRSNEDGVNPQEVSPEEAKFLGIGASQWYNYDCRSCGCETEVEDIVVDALAALGCPRCGGAMQPIDDNSPPTGR